MAKKHVFVMYDDHDNDENANGYDTTGGRRLINEASAEECHAINETAHQTLDDTKDAIELFYHNRKWDRFKKLANTYEMVFTTSPDLSSVAGRTPISRSYFKLWELLHDLNDVMLPANAESTPMVAAFLAEGPGGFMEAFLDYRTQTTTSSAVRDADRLHGMTLVSQSRNVPDWKISDDRRRNLTLHVGVDGTGSLYNFDNIDSLVTDVGPGTCHIVTADGGFDFSGDFNAQERASTDLLTCEIYGAIRLLRVGGSFVLKVYDIRLQATLRLLYALKRCFGAVYFAKPLTSRPANSEKYIVCTQFKGGTDVDAERVCQQLRAHIKNIDIALTESGGCDGHLRCDLDAPCTRFLRHIVHFNVHYIARQIAAITRTLKMIRSVGSMSGDSAAAAAAASSSISTAGARTDQIRLSVAWCMKYGVSLYTSTGS